jgi:hypothetical protein
MKEDLHVYAHGSDSVENLQPAAQPCGGSMRDDAISQPARQTTDTLPTQMSPAPDNSHITDAIC